jgi:hypothetical protein
MNGAKDSLSGLRGFPPLFLIDKMVVFKGNTHRMKSGRFEN